jgi:hypothetical protein
MWERKDSIHCRHGNRHHDRLHTPLDTQARLRVAFVYAQPYSRQSRVAYTRRPSFSSRAWTPLSTRLDLSSFAPHFTSPELRIVQALLVDATSTCCRLEKPADRQFLRS